MKKNKSNIYRHRRLFLPGLNGLLIMTLFLMLISSCNTSTKKSGLRPRTGNEIIYVAMYGSRNFKLRGENPTVGLFYSKDEGKTWVHTGWKQEHTFAVMAVPGGQGDTVFTACGNGVLRTVNGGKFWKIVSSWRMDEVQDVTINPENPKQVFAGSPYGFYRSDNLGKTWKPMDTGLKSLFVSAIRVDHFHPDKVWAGTQDGLYYSNDSGMHWHATNIKVPVRSIRQSMINPQKWAISTTIHGVAVSSNDGETWKFSNGPMDTTTIYRCEFDPRNSNILYAGGWDTGVMVSDNFGETWHAYNKGLGDKPVHGIAVSGKIPGLIFAGTLGSGLYKSIDGGKSWTPIGNDTFVKGQIWDIYVEGEQ